MATFKVRLLQPERFTVLCGVSELVYEASNWHEALDAVARDCGKASYTDLVLSLLGSDEYVYERYKLPLDWDAHDHTELWNTVCTADAEHGVDISGLFEIEEY